ncbi:MAG: TIGR02285 family protein [Spirochaetes bacterium]|nr:TIGR02285 family protein [Spirochaetota bacterium]
MIYDWPPVYIVEGPYKAQGNADAILQFFQEKLTEYEHETLLVNPARAVHEMKQGKKVCMVGTLKTPEREEFLYFSDNIGITLPNAIIIKKDKLKYFNKNRKVSLEGLMSSNQLKAGLAEGRSYTPELDQIINKYKGKSNIIFSNTISMTNLIGMLKINRIDYIIEYPWVVEYIEKVNTGKSELVSIFIEEAIPYSGGVTAAPKNEWGKNIINQINQVLRESKPSPEYQEFVERWNDSNQKLVRELYQSIFLKKEKF